jgi:4-aminobutyrate aminotransferase-like enzyme
VAFRHGYTFGGHPVAAAISLANLDLMERERLNGRVLEHEAALGSTPAKLLDLPIVGDVRGDGYFWAIELVEDKATRETFDAAERERLVRGSSPARCSTTASTAAPTTGATWSSRSPRHSSVARPNSTRWSRSCGTRWPRPST